jgi:hypothetical protein
MKTSTLSSPRNASIAAEPVSPPRERGLEELPDELHREVLEGERRAVEELQQEVVRRQLLERRARLVAKARVGAFDHVGQRRLAEGLARVGRDHAQRGLLVRRPRERGDLRRRHFGDAFGDVEPAVAGQTGEHRRLEVERGRLPAGGNVVHQAVLRAVRHKRYPVIATQTTASPNQVTAYSR